jgi:parvulin-like peptidyl-prolyl isomerase
VPGDTVPDIGSNQQFEQAIAPLENANDVGDRTPVPNGFAIPMLVEKREPNRIPDLAEVREKVLTALRNERAKSQLEETARNLAGSVGGASELEAAAARLGLEVKKEETYRIGSPLGDAGTSAAAEAAIFNLKEGEVTRTPIKIGDNWVVIGATSRKEADLAEFAKQRDMLMLSALSQRRNQVFEDFILATQARMEREGKIKIYEDVLANIGGDEPTITSPGQPRPPGSLPIQIPTE